MAARVKFSLRELARMPEEERQDTFAEDLLHEVLRGQKQGISRLSSVFEFLGYTVPIAASWRQALYELFVLRNVIAHRAGTVDEKAVAQLPSLKRFLGRTIDISNLAIYRYERALIEYLGAVATSSKAKALDSDEGLQPFVEFCTKWCKLTPVPEHPERRLWFGGSGSTDAEDA